MTTTSEGLGRRSVGTTSLWFFGTSASAPMTVLAGGVITTHAATGLTVVAPSFLLLTAALGLFTVGFVAMSRDIPHAASFAAFLALGLGRPAGTAGATVALLAYNAIQVALYGLLGATTSGLVGGPWWVWALAGWAIVATLGVLRITLNARVIGAVLIVELIVIAAFVMVAVAHPADPNAFIASLDLGLFLTEGVGGVLAFGIAAFTGFESIASFREEARDDDTVRRAALRTLLFLGVLYTLASWALVVTVGPDRIVAAARSEGSTIPFTVLGDHLGPVVAGLGVVLLVLSVLGALVSFHNVVARYVFALSREVLPARLGTLTGSRGGVPAGGSLFQSAVALTGIGVFALTGADPLAVMFTWLATLSAVAVMTLMVAACVAVPVYYGTWPARRHRPGPWTWIAAPALGALAMTGVLAVTLGSLGSTVGDPRAGLILPGIIATTAAFGAGWALWLRRHRPDAWAAIGRGQPAPLAVLDRALSRYEL